MTQVAGITQGKRGFIVTTTEETLPGEWATREYAEAVLAMPLPTRDQLRRDRDFWRDQHAKLVQQIRDSDVYFDLAGVVYEHTGGLSSGPEGRRRLSAVFGAMKAVTDP